MNKSDLRVVKTEINIREAFLHLMQAKPLNEISIKEICDLAHCSRNTFYSHYPYKEALYEQIADECVSSLSYGFRPLIRHSRELTPEIMEQYLSNIVSGIMDARNTIIILFANENADSLQSKLSNSLYQNILEMGEELSPGARNNEAFQLNCKYMISGLVAFIIHWIHFTFLDYEEAREILRPLITTSISYGFKYLE